jgi:hypothetical protein
LHNRRAISGLGGTDFATTRRKVIVMTVKEESWRLTPRQREGRALNSVAELLRRILSVPNIYFEPPSALIAADVLAVDRAGAGDLHAVEIKLLDKGPAPVSVSAKATSLAALQEKARKIQVESVYRQLMTIPAHFRYLAIPAESTERIRMDLLQLGLYAQDGVGRLGIIAITEKGVDSPKAEVVLVPERFRVDPAKLKAIETRLLAKSRPDIEVRI